MVLVNQDEAERLHDAHLPDAWTQVLNATAQDGYDVLIEILIGTLYPFLYDAAVQFLVIIVVGAYLARVVADQEVNVRHNGLCLWREFRNDFVQCALNLLDGLFACFHKAIMRG